MGTKDTRGFGIHIEIYLGTEATHKHWVHIWRLKIRTTMVDIYGTGYLRGRETHIETSYSYGN